MIFAAVVWLTPPVLAQCPQLHTPPETLGCPTIEENTLIGISSHESPKPTVLAVLTYDDGMEKLLDCLWKKESGRGKDMIGDYGMAYGHFQIWLSLHPDVTYDCAMDYECSKTWTAKQIKGGHSSWWTTYPKCKYSLYER